MGESYHYTTDSAPGQGDFAPQSSFACGYVKYIGRRTEPEKACSGSAWGGCRNRGGDSQLLCGALFRGIPAICGRAPGRTAMRSRPGALPEPVKSGQKRPDLLHSLVLFRVAMPPRMCRCALFSSSTAFTCRYKVRLKAGRRSARSLCTVDLEIPKA